MGFEVLEGSPSKQVIAVKAVGKLTGDDYEQTLQPLVDEQLKKSDGLRIVIVLGPEWEGMTAGAVWDDFKMGMGKLGKWKRCAVVTDRDWIETATKAFAWMTPAEAKVFETDELADAMKWASED
jgi:hypothetical protein